MAPSTRIALTLLAGYCDTATFIHVRGVFSAHVTGNFVLFAAALGRGLEPADYLKLWTFPVFALAVSIATLIYLRAETAGRKRSGLTAVLGSMFLALFLAAGLSFAEPRTYAALKFDICITLLVVLAMGLQNALHHFLPGAMTTVMTGTVMNTIARLTRKVVGHKQEEAVTAPAVNPLYMIGVFAVGCILAGVTVRILAFKCLVLPAAVLALLWIIERNRLSRWKA